MNIDQRQLNLVKSLLIASVSLGLILAFYSFFIWPIEESYRQEYMNRCYDHVNGEWVEKENIACSAPHGSSFFYIVLGVIPFLIFIASMNYFEKKRLHNWRSYK